MIRMMIGIPKLRGDPEIVAGGPSVHRIFQTFPNSRLIAVVTGAIEMTIAKGNRFGNKSGQHFIRNFPGTQTDGRNLSTAPHFKSFQRIAHEE